MAVVIYSTKLTIELFITSNFNTVFEIKFRNFVSPGEYSNVCRNLVFQSTVTLLLLSQTCVELIFGSSTVSNTAFECVVDGIQITTLGPATSSVCSVFHV